MGLRAISGLNPAQYLEDKGVFQSDILERLVAAAHAAVASIQFGFQQQQVVVGFLRAQLGYPFCRFPVLHAAVVVTGHRENGRIGLGLDVFVGRIGFDPLEDFGLVML